MITTLEESLTDTTLVERGKAFYDLRLKALLEPQFVGQFVAIEPDSGQYFVGKNTLETMRKAWAALPDAQVYLVRIGYGYAHKLGGLRRYGAS